MQINSPHFIIENESELGWKFHWLRAEHEEPLTFVPEGWVFQLTRLIKLNADGLMSRKLI